MNLGANCIVRDQQLEHPRAALVTGVGTHIAAAATAGSAAFAHQALGQHTQQ